MGIVKNQAHSDGGVNTGSANVTNRGSGFTTLRDLIGRVDDRVNRTGNTYAWQDYSQPQSQAQREEQESINQMPRPGEKTEDEKAKGRQNWDQESKQEMNTADKVFATLGKIGDLGQADVGGDFSNNLFQSTVGTLLSPMFSVGSAAANFWEATTGRPVTEADDEGKMPDYELDSNQKAAAAANMAIDVAGLAFGGSKDMLAAGARGVKYGLAKRAGDKGKEAAADIAKKAVDDFGSSGFATLKRYAGNALEEGVEEAAQQGISDIRYDQYDEGTAGRMAEAGLWGAVGGVSMTGVAHLANRAIGGKKQDTAVDNKPDSDATSGRPGYKEFATPAKTIGQADADIQESIDKLQTEDRYIHGSTSYKVAQGYPDIRPDETVLGTEGIRKMYYESDDSANYIANKMGMKREDMDQVFATGDSRQIAKLFNDAFANGTSIEVYDKRDPHTSRDSYMKFRVREVVPGNTVMTNTMVPQMPGGDVDGDMLSVMWNTDVASRALYPTEAMMYGRRLPVSSGNYEGTLPGRYAENFIDKDYAGFTLDEGVFKEDWNVNGVDAVADALSPIASLTDENGESLAEKYHRVLRDSWAGDFIGRLSDDERYIYGDEHGLISRDFLKKELGFDETVYQMNEMRREITEALVRGGMTAEQANVAANIDYMSEIIWKLQRNTGTYLMLSKMSTSGVDEILDLVIKDLPVLANASAPMKTGSKGAHSRAVTVFSQLNMINQAFDMAANTGLRFKQNMYWMATSSRIVDEAIRNLPEPSQVQGLILAMMRINSEESTPIRMMENLFRGYVSSAVRRELKIDSLSFDNSKVWDDVDRLRNAFVKCYNDVLSNYEKALKATGIDGEFRRYFSKGRSRIDGPNDSKLATAFLDIFGTYEADGDGHTLMQMIDNTINGEPGANMIDMVLDRGAAANKFYRGLVSAYNAKRDNMGRRFEGYVEDLNLSANIDWDADGNPMYNPMDEVWIQYYWEMMKQAIGIEECHAYGLVNFKSALHSRWGRALFGKNTDDRMDAVLKLRLMYKYRDYGKYKLEEMRSRERAGKAKSDAKKKNLLARADKMAERAVASAKGNLGISALDNDIVNEIVTKGTDNYLMNLLGDKLTYAEKSEWFAKRRKRFGVGSETNLIEQAVRKDGSSIGGSAFSNALMQMERAYNKCDQMSRDNAVNLVRDVFDLATKDYDEAQISRAIVQTMANSSQKINIDLIATVYFDAADVLKKHVDKGTSTPTEAQLYQMVTTIYDTGAKSAINKITGMSLGSGTAMDYAKSKREILRALSDPTYKGLMISQDASGYTYVTRDAMFERVAGIQLNGRDPSFGEWRAFFENAPQLITWIGDTTFVPTPESDSVKEGMSGSIVEQIKKNVAGTDESDRYEREVSAIESRIVNDPNNARLILGIIGDRHKGSSLDNLLENPERFRDEVRTAFRKLATYAHRVAANPLAKDIVSNKFLAFGRDTVSAQMVGIVDDARRISTNMTRYGAKVNSALAKDAFSDMVSNVVFRRTLDSDIVKSAMAARGIDDASLDGMDSRVKAELQAFRHATEAEIIGQKLSFTMAQMSGSYDPESLDRLSSLSIDNVDTFAIERKLISIGLSEEEARSAVSSAMSTPILDMQFNEDVIVPSDLDPANSEVLADKMHKIIASGKYRIDQNVTRDKLLAKINDLHLRGKEGELQKLTNRYNGLILTQLIDDFAGAMGPDYNRGFYSAGIDAYTQLSTMMNGIIEDADSGKLNISASKASVGTDFIDFNFTNRSLGVLADFAVSSLEGSGNSLMSGIEGGEYQQLLSIASLNGSYSFGVPPKVMRVLDVKRRLQDGDHRLYGASFIMKTFPVSDPNDVSGMRPGRNEKPRANLSLATINDVTGGNYIPDYVDDGKGNPVPAYMFVYELDDAPLPDDQHMVPQMSNSPYRNANALVNFLIDLVYDRSEPGVFKRKKSIGAFDRIASAFNSDYNLGNSVIARPTATDPETYRQQLIRNFRDVRGLIADHYLQLFQAEKMDKFGSTESMMLSMLTTQVIDVEMADGSHRTLCATDLWNPKAFAAMTDPEIGGFDISQVKSYRVICQPLSSVCTWIGNHLADRFSKAYRTGDSKNVTEKDFTRAAKSAFKDYRNFGYKGSEGIGEMISMISPLTRAGHRDIEVGRSALPPSRLMNAMEGTERGELKFGASSVDRRAVLNEDWQRSITNATALFQDVSRDADASEQSNDIKFAIAFSRVDDNVFSTDRYDNAAAYEAITDPLLTKRPLSNVMVDPTMRTSVVSALKDKSGYKRVFDELVSIRKDSGIAPVLLVPTRDASSARLPFSADTGTKVIAKAADGSELTSFDVYDPMLVPLSDSYLGATPDLFPVSPSEIESYIANGLLSDSASLFNPDSSNKKSDVDSVFGIGHDIFFRYPSLRNSPIYMPGTLNNNAKADLDAFRDAFLNREGDEPRFVFPKFPEGNTTMSEREMTDAVERYLSVAETHVDDPVSPCFLKNGIRLGDCIGFVKTRVPGSEYLGDEYVYSPVILNKGGIPVNLSSVICSIDPRNRDMLQVDVSGAFSADEADVIKIAFGIEPYKSEGRMATRDEWNDYGIRLGTNIDVNGHVMDVDVMYSHETENGRLIDRGTSTLAENAFYANQLTGGGLFIRMVDGKPQLDFDSAAAVGISPTMLRRLTGTTWTDEWDLFINGDFVISTDRDVNEAIKSVAVAVRNANCAIGSRVQISPSVILSAYSFNSDGEPVLNLMGTSSTDYYFGLILNKDRTLKMFHFLNESLCPNGMDDDSQFPYVLNRDGQIRILVKDPGSGAERAMYANGHFMLSRVKHDSSQLGIPTRRSAFGNQQVINSILERGFSNARDISEAIKLVSIESGSYTPYLIDGRYFKDAEAEDDPFRTDNVDAAIIGHSALDYRYDDKVSKAGQTTYMNMLKVIDNPHDRNILGPADGDLHRTYEEFNKRMDWDVNPNPLMNQAIFKMATGYSFNDGDGSDTVTIAKLREGFDRIIHNIENSDGYFIKGGYVNGRYSLPLGPRPIMRYIWNHSGLVRDKVQKAGLTFDQWIEAAAKEMDATKEAVGSIRPNQKKKQKALETIMEFCYRSNNMGYRGPSLSGYYSVGDFVNSYDPLFRNLEAADKDLVGIRKQQQQEMAERIGQWKAGRDLDKYKRIDVPMSPNGFAASWFGLHKDWWEFTAKNLEMMSRTMSMCTSPMLGLSALASRAKGAGITNATLFLHNRGNWVINQRDLKNALKSTDAKAVWSAITEIQFTQDGIQGMLEALDHGDVVDYVEHMHKRAGKVNKLSRTITKIQTADGALTDWQMRIYVNEFAQNLPDDSIWLEVEANGRTRIENRVLADPAGFLVDTLTLQNNNPDFTAANKARDLAMAGDFCQRSSYGMIMTEIFRQHPIGEFLVVTNFLKFPQYAINSGGFFLQQIAPVSSLYHWSTSLLIQKAKSENPNFFGVDLSKLDLESTLRYKSFKQAAYADAAHLGVSALVAIILQGVIKFDPPEDEEGNIRYELMGNLNEWTVFGERLGDIWWLQDIMGPAFALAAFSRTVMMGQPRLDIIGNWMGQALWNNPVMRVSDVVTSLFGDDESKLDQLIEEADLYQNAKGGEPSLSDMASTGLFTYGMNWMSQFFLPAILKETYRWSPQHEISYKRTYVTDKNGNVVTDENGMPYTTITSYQDQMYRKMARRNPFIALVMNATQQSETGYSNWDWMNSLSGKYDPVLTTYYQTDELACVKYYSLYTTDENGNEVSKSPEEINAVATEVITILEACDDPQELRASGWVLPYDTKVYVSKVLWDTKYYTQQLYSKWKEEEAYDYTVLGNGDFGTGQKIAEQAKQQYYDDLNHIDDLYDLLWDDAFSGGITQYNRYNTTYQQDAYGEWYATGFRPGNPIFSIPTAPGSLEDPGPTLGMEGNWETPAARNPEISAGGRALVPIDTTYTDRPGISSWAEDGDGGGYSDMVALTYGALAGNELGDNGNGDRSDIDTWYSRPYWTRSGYRNYYRRSYGGGGGGGGGYTPNLYSRLPSVNMPYASTMYSERSYDPSYDYLRPNFETKGSREAYKRSDI